MNRNRAKEWRRKIELAAQTMPDKDASQAAELFPTLKADGSLIKAGTRIRWGTVVKIAAVDLWDTQQNDPDHAPALWEDIEYREGIRIIPEVITVTKAFSKDERGWWKDEIYVSLVDMNVYTPDQYAPNWRKE